MKLSTYIGLRKIAKRCDKCGGSGQIFETTQNKPANTTATPVAKAPATTNTGTNPPQTTGMASAVPAQATTNANASNGKVPQHPAVQTSAPGTVKKVDINYPATADNTQDYDENQINSASVASQVQGNSTSVSNANKVYDYFNKQGIDLNNLKNVNGQQARTWMQSIADVNNSLNNTTGDNTFWMQDEYLNALPQDQREFLQRRIDQISRMRQENLTKRYQKNPHAYGDHHLKTFGAKYEYGAGDDADTIRKGTRYVEAPGIHTSDSERLRRDISAAHAQAKRNLGIYN